MSSSEQSASSQRSARNPAIDRLRILGVAMVAFYHAGMFPGGVDMGPAGRILTLAGEAALAAALPLLCAISGWAFFRDVDVSSIEWYLPKLKRRFFRLLLPYFAWGALFTAAYVALGGVSGRVAERLAEHGVDSVRGYLAAVFDLKGHVLYGPLWYLRAIFACAVFSPLYALALAHGPKTLKFAGAVLTGLAVAHALCSLGFAQYPPCVFASFGIGAFAARETRFFRSPPRETKPPFLAGDAFFIYVAHLAVNRAFEWPLAAWASQSALRTSVFFFSAFALSIAVPVALRRLARRAIPNA